MQRTLLLVGVCALACAFGATPAHGQIIGVDFYGGGGGGTPGVSTAMGPAETAGTVPAANWNSFTGATQATGQSLIDGTGASTGATVSWTSNNTWNTPIALGTGDVKLMKG